MKFSNSRVNKNIRRIIKIAVEELYSDKIVIFIHEMKRHMLLITSAYL